MTSVADSNASPSIPIITLRGLRVILSQDLAEIYAVETRALNQAMRRNAARFPEDFAFQLTAAETRKLASSRSQTVILKRGQNVKYPPVAFTEHGALMAATVLNSPRAVQMSVYVVRAFISLRQFAMHRKELHSRLEQIERQLGAHDRELKEIVHALRSLVAPAVESPRRRIGFTPPPSP
jgi:hypothetical protein